MAANICELVDQLPNSSNKRDNLEKIKILVSQYHSRRLGDVIPNISFKIIFECLATEDSKEISVCCDVLEKLLQGLDVQSILPQFSVDLLQGLSHPAENVKLLSLKQAHRVARENPQLLAQHTDILSDIIQQIADDSLTVAKEAALTLIALGDNEDAVTYILKSEGLLYMEQLLDVSDTVKFRTYELITDLASLSPNNIASACSAGLLQRLINEVYKDDVLVQLNAIELLTRLASVEYGLAFMEDEGIMARLDEMMRNVDSNPIMSFLLPGLVKFFGGVASLQPKEVCNRHGGFLPLVFSLHENHDLSTQALAAETLGHIGRTVDGKHLLEIQGRRTLTACKHMGNMLRTPNTDLHLKVLPAIVHLLALPVCEQSSDLLAVIETWYNQLASDPMSLLMANLEKPIPALRCAVFKVMVAIATQHWAQSKFRDHPTFCEFLLNRSTEKSKEENEGKFEIVQTLVDSPTCMEVMGRVYYVKLKQYVAEGPFFVRAESMVAIEDRNT